MATVARGTPNFAVPPSQNTAPVNEFRCLYTHDLRKKQKKWHDGSVRFHTFNRRVMVYDDAKNYIGDLHYRVDDDFGEGVELQLDRGVLVEVGEPRGQTYTDLTGINDRGRGERNVTANASSPAQPRSIRRVNAADILGRPKSLAEVLGASQDRLGRARLPLQSPYENRQALEEVRNEGPPPKRQKPNAIDSTRRDKPAVRTDHVILEKENLAIARPSASKQPTQRQNLPTPVAASPKPMHGELGQISSNSLALLKPTVSKNPIARNKHVVDLSSDDDDTVNKITKPTLPPTLRQKNSEKLSDASSRKKKTGPSAHNEKPQTAKSKAVDPSRENLKSQAAVNREAVSSARSTGSLSTTRTEMTSLRFLSFSKPRPKLMYRALLPMSGASVKSLRDSPRSSRQTEKRDAAHADVIQQTGEVAMNVQESGARESILQVADIDDIDDIDDIIELPRSSTGNHVAHESVIPNIPVGEQNINESNTLFLTQDEPFSLPSQRSNIVDDDFDAVLLQAEGDNAESGGFDTQTGPGDDVETQDFISADEADDSLSEELPSPDRSLQPTVTTPNHISRSATPIQPQEETSATAPCLPSITRPFRRFLSEGDPPRPSLPETSPLKSTLNVNIPIPPMIDTATFSPSRPNRHTTPKSVAIQRSKSDGAVVIPRPERIETIAISDTVKQVDPNEQGPWTKIEAFLLFDKWPESKEKDKPTFHKPVNDNENDGSDDDNEINVNSLHTKTTLTKANLNSRFRSARSVLRDEQ